MNRKDYRKMMQTKKRNKNIAKATMLGAVGVGVFGLNTVVNAEEWRANSVEQIKEAIKEVKDGIYVIKIGDTLSAISEATGITVDTLAKVNNIQNIDLIYSGDKLSIDVENGKIALVDSNNNIKNEVPLSKEDKKGIQEVQKNDNNVYTSITNKKETTKPVSPTTKPTDNGGQTKPTKPVDPEKEDDFWLQSVHFYDMDVSIDEPIESRQIAIKIDGNTEGVNNGILDLSTIELPENYELAPNQSSQMTVYSSQGTNVFLKRKGETPIDPVDPEPVGEVNVAIDFILIDENGNYIETLQHMPFKWLDGEELSWTADSTWGDAVLISEQTQTIIAEEGSVMTFTYQRDTSVDIPEWVFGLGEIPTTQADLADDSLTIGNVPYTFLTEAEAHNWAEANADAWYYSQGVNPDDQNGAWWQVWTVRMKNGDVRYSVHFNIR